MTMAPPPRHSRSSKRRNPELPTRRKPSLVLVIRRLTPDLWPALEDLFGARGACNGCWCMYWRVGSAYRQRPRERNKAAFREIVRRGPPPGLLAFHAGLAVGWCQITPRDALPWLDRTWRLRRVDAAPVWCISCFYVRKGYRRRGVTSALIAAAVGAARGAGAPALEAYPLDADLTPSASGTGYASTFTSAGFVVVARHVPPRPIMRHDLEARGRGTRSSAARRRPGSRSVPAARRRQRSARARGAAR
jgi:GNAT superfamily N-acetyltransferase